jgi:nucleoside phosphorylase
MALLMEDSPETDEAPRAALPKTPVLITAATKWEVGPLVKALKLVEAAPGRYTGTFGGRPVTLLKTGIGAKSTADALGQSYNPSDFGLAISAGLCGAMLKDAKTGDIVADAREADLDLVKPLRETAIKLALPFHFGKILHTNIVLAPAAKKALGEEHRALACDMETAAVRRWADGKAPAIAVRVVLDEMHEAIPSDAPEGEDAASLARFALAHAADMPALIKTGWRSARAMKTLSRFLTAYLEAL